MSTPSELLTNLANAVREKTGLTNPLSISAMTEAVESIVTVTDFISPTCSTVKEVTFLGSYLRGDAEDATSAPPFFRELTSLEKFLTPNLLRAPEYLCYQCSSLREVDLSQCTYIGKYAFYNANLQSLVLPNVTTIGIHAFYSNNELTTIDLGEKIESISVFSFSYTNATTLFLRNPEKVVDINDINAFASTPIDNWEEGTSIYVPDNLYNEYLEDTNWCLWGQDMIDSEMEPIIKPLSTYTGGTTQ